MKLLQTLTIVSIHFIISNAQFNPHWQNGRNTIVHLFEWKFLDIAAECERFLAPKGYAGVQTSPVSENMIVQNRPWYERYQPVSYKIDSRSGNEMEFAEMTRRCNAVGVRIYPDAVINHMAYGTGQTNGVGVAGSTADVANRNYPGVPYSHLDFNAPCGIKDYNNAHQVRNCDLEGLPDLNQGVEWVRDKIVDYMNHLIDLGAAGFRIDACKHMWPGDLEIIFGRLKSLNTSHGFEKTSRPFIYQEVIDLGGEGIKKHEYTSLGAITEFRFGNEIGRVFQGMNKLKWLRNFGSEWNLLTSTKAVTFVDNHDNQRTKNEPNILTYKKSRPYKMATAFHMAWPYGIPKIMSSFDFPYSHTEQGPPANKNGEIMSPQFDNDGACTNGWICEHRWRQIYNMVGFRNVVYGTSVDNWWDNGNDQIAFSRGNRGFIVFNGENRNMKEWLTTGLPAGIYCDVISGIKKGNACTGKSITIHDDSRAQFSIGTNDSDGVLAIHINAKL